MKDTVVVNQMSFRTKDLLRVDLTYRRRFLSSSNKPNCYTLPPKTPHASLPKIHLPGRGLCYKQG